MSDTQMESHIGTFALNGKAPVGADSESLRSPAASEHVDIECSCGWKYQVVHLAKNALPEAKAALAQHQHSSRK